MDTREIGLRVVKSIHGKTIMMATMLKQIEIGRVVITVGNLIMFSQIADMITRLNVMYVTNTAIRANFATKITIRLSAKTMAPQFLKT